jgi:hypothetical protein
MSTSCGGSGRGGHGATYSAYTGAIWDDAGDLYALEPLYSNPDAGPGFTAYDSYGNEEYQNVESTDFQWASGFVPVPRVTSLSITAGSTAGGEAETISGSGFTNANTVDFGQTSVPFTVVNDNTITVTTPPDPVTSNTTLDVTVSSSEGTSLTSTADQFTYALPQVSGLSVTDGPSGGGTPVTINGVGFLGATAVNFGSLPVSSFTVLSDTTIATTAPADTTLSDDATVDVSVVSVAGTGSPSSADQYTYAVRPRITSIQPSSGPVSGGTTITIAGADLAYATKLTIGESSVYFWYNPDGTISAQTPSHDAYEAVPVILTTVGGSNVSTKAARFDYVQGTPNIAVTPTSGPAGTLIGVSGYDFRKGEKLTVTYGDSGANGSTTVTLCTTTADSIGYFACGATIPAKKAGPLGSHSITVSGRHGTVTDTATGTFTLT